MAVDLGTPLSLRASFMFPIQSRTARRELLWGTLLLVVLPGLGWLLNMGHRIAFVRRMQRGQAPFPAWSDPARPWTQVYAALLYDGTVTFVGMVGYHLPGAVLMALGEATGIRFLVWVGILAWIVATVLVPGFMTHYCKEQDPRVLLHVGRVLQRVRQAGSRYWHAWAITLVGLLLSFLGLAALGVGFFLTSVWFWQTAGFSFATVFSQRFGLVDPVTYPHPQ